MPTVVTFFLQLFVCILFGILILFLLIGFPCKLSLSEFIDKQISPVMLSIPHPQSPGYLFAKLHV